MTETYTGTIRSKARLTLSGESISLSETDTLVDLCPPHDDRFHSVLDGAHEGKDDDHDYLLLFLWYVGRITQRMHQILISDVAAMKPTEVTAFRHGPLLSMLWRLKTRHRHCLSQCNA